MLRCNLNFWMHCLCASYAVRCSLVAFGQPVEQHIQCHWLFAGSKQVLSVGLTVSLVQSAMAQLMIVYVKDWDICTVVCHSSHFRSLATWKTWGCVCMTAARIGPALKTFFFTAKWDVTSFVSICGCHISIEVEWNVLVCLNLWVRYRTPSVKNYLSALYCGIIHC